MSSKSKVHGYFSLNKEGHDTVTLITERALAAGLTFTISRSPGETKLCYRRDQVERVVNLLNNCGMSVEVAGSYPYKYIENKGYAIEMATRVVERCQKKVKEGIEQMTKANRELAVAQKELEQLKQTQFTVSSPFAPHFNYGQSTEMFRQFFKSLES